MIIEQHYLNGSPVNPPKNWGELLIELNYGKDQFPQGNTISITNPEWVRENYDLIIDYIEDGKTGTGVGITEGLPYKIDLSEGASTITVFNGYLDLMTGLHIKDKIRLTTKATSNATVDWVNDKAGGFTFEYLASPEFKATGQPGYISINDYRFIPYVNNTVPDYTQSAIATFMVFAIIDKLNQSIKEIAELTVDLSNPFTTANSILSAIVQIGYLIVLLATLIKVIEDMIKFIISPVKYHAGMYVRDLFAKACQYLGLTFKSDIWEAGSPFYNEFILPEKLYNPPNKLDSTIFGYLLPDKNDQLGYFKGTFADLLNRMKVKYNAKIIVTANNVLYLIRKDKSALPPQYQLPNIYIPERTYNTDELISNYLISYQIDESDTNTMQNYSGTIYQVICQQKTVNYLPFVMLKNEVRADIQFSRAARKTSLTTPEKIIKEFLKVFDLVDSILVDIVNTLISIADGVISFLNKVIKALKVVGIKVGWKIKPIPKLKKSSLASSIDNRVGMLMLQADHFTKPKIFILYEGSANKYNKIDLTNSTVESALYHWENFHFVNSMITTYAGRPTGNQYLIKEYEKVPFDWSDFTKVFSNNRIFAPDGTEAIVESLKFCPPTEIGGGYAKMKVRFQEIWTNNLTETFLNPSGQ